MTKKHLIGLAILIIVLIIGGVAYGSYYFWQKPAEKVIQQACSKEAKLCPDGSAVGRTGPNCEFTACPEAKPGETANWQTFINVEYGFEFKFPKNFGTDIWRASEWPPKASMVLANEDLIKTGCPDIPDGAAPEESQVTLNGLNFRLFKISDGVAGSTYTTYCYATQKDQNYYAIQFIIRYTSGCGESCGPYCGTQYEAACQNFDKVKEVEKPIEQMVSTLRFTK